VEEDIYALGEGGVVENGTPIYACNWPESEDEAEFAMVIRRQQKSKKELLLAKMAKKSETKQH
jgi:hypothetical protein